VKNLNKITLETKEKYSRECPICGRKIYYKWRTDFYTGKKNNTKCIKCFSIKTRFKPEHTLNDMYSIRENSLDELLKETTESFYWLGFLIADGSFSKNAFEISLSEKDKLHLDKFAKFINLTKELKYREKTKSYRIAFSNKKSVPIVMDKYGILKNKTYNPIDFSIFEKYSNSLIISMLIGLIDGDGNIQNNHSSNSFTINITSHECWNNFYTRLIKKLKINARIKKYNSRKTVQNIIISKKETIDELYNHIIINNIPILERKWKEVFNQRNK